MLALKRTNDNQNSAATVLRQIVQEQLHAHTLKHSPDGVAAGAAVSTGEVTDTPLVEAVKGNRRSFPWFEFLVCHHFEM